MDNTNSSKRLGRSDFDFQLPEGRIAQEPLAQRDASRLLVRHASGVISHSHVADLVTLLPKDALLIVNDSQDFASRLEGKLSSGGKVELFLLSSPLGSPIAKAFAFGKPMRKLKTGVRIYFSRGVEAEVIDKTDAEGGGLPLLSVAFNKEAKELHTWLNECAYIPLPPYIVRKNPKPAAQSDDRLSYQTVYARHLGSVAAPTAGLHFTNELLTKLRMLGIESAAVTLHVGAGTFLPVKSDALAEHQMHKESFMISAATLELIKKAKEEKRAVVCVGTTSMRCLESLKAISLKRGCSMESLCGGWLETSLFIYPKTDEERFKCWAADYLFTNFHQAQSTLFMLVSALIGRQEALAMYKEAVAKAYRFHSYGDANLLEL